MLDELAGTSTPLDHNEWQELRNLRQKHNQYLDKLKKLHGEEDHVDQESEEDEDDFHEDGEVVKKATKKAGRQGVSAEVYGDWNKKDNFVPPVI